MNGTLLNKYEYDNDGNVSKETDYQGNVTTKFDYNDTNQVVRTEVYRGDSTKSDDFESRMQYTYYDPAIRRFIGADVLFDWAGLTISVIDLSHNLTDPLAYAGVACDVIDIFFPGCYTGEIVNTVKYSVRYGPDFVMAFISKFGDGATAMAVKHGDEVIEGGTKIADLSKTALKHPLNRHTPTRVAQQFKHMDKVSINKYLDEVSFLISHGRKNRLQKH